MVVRSFLLCFLFLSVHSYSFEQQVVRTLKSFGAKGDGKTNDTQAFTQAAAFFNSRGGNGTLEIDNGTYLVGQQVYNNGAKGLPVYSSATLLYFKNVNNLVIKGNKNVFIKYADSLHLGAFDPATGKSFTHGGGRFTNATYKSEIGCFITLFQCDNIRISHLSINGNNNGIILGGVFGDTGYQVSADGITILNSYNVSIDNINASYFGRDGIIIRDNPRAAPDSIFLSNCTFQYNCRQGLSWVGGNQLAVTNCHFDHTGKSHFSSAPRAGVDIEDESGGVFNGSFTNCTFIDNAGCGMASDGGKLDSACTFTGCTFWGTTSWSAWVMHPAFSFINCNFYGAFVHGYNAKNQQDATYFKHCYFEDKPYNGKRPFGAFLIDSNGAGKMTLDGCTLVIDSVKLLWLDNSSLASTAPESNYNIFNCHFIVSNAFYPPKTFFAILRGVNYKNNILEYKDPAAKTKDYWIVPGGKFVDLGGNQVIYR